MFFAQTYVSFFFTIFSCYLVSVMRSLFEIVLYLFACILNVFISFHTYSLFLFVYTHTHNTEILRIVWMK